MIKNKVIRIVTAIIPIMVLSTTVQINGINDIKVYASENSATVNLDNSKGSIQQNVGASELTGTLKSMYNLIDNNKEYVVVTITKTTSDGIVDESFYTDKNSDISKALDKAYVGQTIKVDYALGTPIHSLNGGAFPLLAAFPTVLPNVILPGGCSYYISTLKSINYLSDNNGKYVVITISNGKTDQSYYVDREKNSDTIKMLEKSVIGEPIGINSSALPPLYISSLGKYIPPLNYIVPTLSLSQTATTTPTSTETVNTGTQTPAMVSGTLKSMYYAHHYEHLENGAAINLNYLVITVTKTTSDGTSDQSYYTNENSDLSKILEKAIIGQPIELCYVIGKIVNSMDGKAYPLSSVTPTINSSEKEVGVHELSGTLKSMQYLIDNNREYVVITVATSTDATQDKSFYADKNSYIDKILSNNTVGQPIKIKYVLGTPIKSLDGEAYPLSSVIPQIMPQDEIRESGLCGGGAYNVYTLKSLNNLEYNDNSYLIITVTSIGTNDEQDESHFFIDRDSIYNNYKIELLQKAIIGQTIGIESTDGSPLCTPGLVYMPAGYIVPSVSSSQTATTTPAPATSSVGTVTTGTETPATSSVGTVTIGTQTPATSSVGTVTIGTQTPATSSIGTATTGTQTPATSSIGSVATGTQNISEGTIKTSTTTVTPTTSGTVKQDKEINLSDSTSETAKSGDVSALPLVSSLIVGAVGIFGVKKRRK